MALDPVALELARRMPWIHAESESWWTITGDHLNGDTFRDCIAQVVPFYVTGCESPPLFQMTLHGGQVKFVSADRITHARRLILVYADEPNSAFYEDEQDLVDRGLEQ